MIKQFIKSGAGFTLIEILVVVGMIGVLTAGSLLVINPALQLQRSRDATRKSEIKQIQSAIEQYKADNGSYPGPAGTSSSPIYGWAPVGGMALNSNTITYLQKIPTGPGNIGSDGCLGYLYASNGTSYTIFTKLENEKDPDALAVKPAPNYVPYGGSSPLGENKTYSWSSGSCNTGINSNYVYNFWVNNP